MSARSKAYEEAVKAGKGMGDGLAMEDSTYGAFILVCRKWSAGVLRKFGK